MTQIVITDAGMAEALSLANSGLNLVINEFKLGTGVAYQPLKSDTALRGAEVYSNIITEIIKVNDYRLDYRIFLSSTLGDFSFGEVGIFTDNGTLFALLSLPYLFQKTASSGFDKGNTYEIRIPIQFDTSMSNIQVIDTEVIVGKVLEISNVSQLPAANLAETNIYMTQGGLYNQKTLCFSALNDDLWYFSNYVREFSNLEVVEVNENQIVIFYSGEIPSLGQAGDMVFQVITGDLKSRCGIIDNMYITTGNRYVIDYSSSNMDVKVGDFVELWRHNVIVQELPYTEFTQLLMRAIDPLDAQRILLLGTAAQKNIGTGSDEVSTNEMLGTLAFYDEDDLFDAVSIRTPRCITPANGANNLTLTPTLTGSPFAAAYSIDTRLNRQWQIDLATNDFSNPIQTHTANADSWTITTALEQDTVYKWRVRDTSNLGIVSLWSEPFQFTTADIIVARPRIISPANAAINIEENPTITTTAFDQIGGDSHASTDWQISLNDTFTSIIYQSLADTTNKISITIPRGNLQANQTRYYVRARHRGQISGPSEWSSSIYFNTKQNFYLAPSAQIVKQFGVGGNGNPEPPLYAMAWDGGNRLLIGNTRVYDNLHGYNVNTANNTIASWLGNIWVNYAVSLADVINGDLIAGPNTGVIYRYNGIPAYNTTGSRAQPVQTLNLGTGTGTADIAWTGTNLIVCNADVNRIYIFNGFSNQLVNSFAAPGGRVIGVAWDGTNLISASRTASRIYVHNGLTQNVLTSFAAPGPTIDDICMVGDTLVTADNSTARVYFHGKQAL